MSKEVKDLTDPAVVSELTDQELENANNPPEEKPANGPEQETPQTPPAPENPEQKPPTEGEEVPEKKPDESTAENAELILGKFKTEDDLRKAATELGKNLYGESPATKLMVAQFEKMDTEELSAFYREMEADQSTRSKPEEKRPDEPVKTEEELQTTRLDNPEAQKDFDQAVTEETFRQFNETPLGREMSKKQIALPTTEEEWDALQTAYPIIAMKLEQTMNDIHAKVIGEANAYATAAEKQEEQLIQEIKTSRQLITDFSRKLKYEITEKEMQDFLMESVKDPSIYYDNHGVPYAREKAIYKRYLAEKFPDVADKLVAVIEANGRIQAADDLANQQKDSVRTVSTTKLPGAKGRTDKTKIDLSDKSLDDSVIAGLTDAEIDAYVAESKKGT